MAAPSSGVVSGVTGGGGAGGACEAAGPSSLPSPPAVTTVGDVLRRVSIIRPSGEHASSCGYCHGEGATRTSYGASVPQLTVLDYQAMADAGWRRSGDYAYVTANDPRTCCPNITIRLDALAFRATKAQRKLVRRFNRYLRGEVDAVAQGVHGDDTPPATAPIATSATAAGGASAGGGAGGGASVPLPDATALRLHRLALDAVADWLGADFTLPPVSAHGRGTGCWVRAATAGMHRGTGRPPPGTAECGGTPPTHYTGLVHAVLAACKQGGAGVGAACTPASAAEELVARMHRILATTSHDSMDATTTVPWRSITIAPAANGCGTIFFVAPGSSPPPSHVVGGGVAVATPVDTSAATPSATSPAARGGGGVGAPPRPAKRSRREGAVGGEGERSGDAPPATTTAPPSRTEGKRRAWKVETVPAAFEEGAYQLFVRYQAAVHHEPPSKCTRDHYTWFLCASPLIPEPFPPTLAPARVPVWDVDGGKWSGGRARGGKGKRSDVALDGHAAEVPLRRCLSAAAVAWVEGEGSGKGRPLTAPMAERGKGVDGEEAATAAIAQAFGGHDPDVVFHDLAPCSACSTSTASAGGARGHDLAVHGYGTFHHRYYLDGQLVAVGVVDVLPLALSSVYLFYDPDLSHLELGKLTALREIQWVQRAATTVSPRLQHYYLGLYVHPCPKMRYKADYAPSELLCPRYKTWVPTSIAIPKLDDDKYAILTPEAVVPTAGAALKVAAASTAAKMGAIPVALFGASPESLVPMSSLPTFLSSEGVATTQRLLRELCTHLTPALADRVVVLFR